MQILSFRVQNFRSVEDSDWIDIDRVTALIGTNESGKTNLLLPLWKLHPANDGLIDDLADYPRKKYNTIRIQETKPIFISARFSIEEKLANELAALSNSPADQLLEVIVEKDYSNNQYVSFPLANPVRDTAVESVLKAINDALNDISGAIATKGEEAQKGAIEEALKLCTSELSNIQTISSHKLRDAIDKLPPANLEGATRRSVIAPRLAQLHEALESVYSAISVPHPDDCHKAVDLVLKRLPHFVYYSNYGNLDSEIYLPHVIENLRRKGLGSKEEAKARTLKVLFDFVKLKPEEIKELGAEVEMEDEDEGPTDEEIAVTARKKKERDVLLQSAGTELTGRFREWWRQGDYRFRFQADGDHFRIWVSDDKRTEDIELENRSTGLQWFLSFFLIFLVESLDSHKDSILLLDEPGLSLHPLAQEDLSKFFEGLSGSNQLIYTTHSPFLVDADHLERVKAVFVGEDGTTRVSTNLKSSDQKTAESKSIYPVHAALGLSVSKTLLLGCKPIIVEGQSDQFYLSAIKNILIGKGLIKPSKEVLFIPAWGVRGVKAVVSIVSGLEETLPTVILDSDGVGIDFSQKLSTSIYKGQQDRIVMVGDYSTVSKDAEIEDIIPPYLIAKVADRQLRAGSDEDFSDSLDTSLAIVPQIEAFASKHNAPLAEGWKVDVARLVKQRLMREEFNDQEYLGRWQKLFAALDV